MLEALVKVLKQVESAFLGLTFGKSDFPFLDLLGVIVVTARDGLFASLLYFSSGFVADWVVVEWSVQFPGL
ncbi:hypothetical protein DY000_02019188 [Brassica cretica]|uniref:Uncharacterized protein n=1 Tax=Brassica cretica TaxID=69181 RepID=A0ABQ7CMT0_BRACR|nr:hypothetical protein DY000_02019188 [Brassica cretica]